MYPQATDAAGGYEPAAAATAPIHGVGEVYTPRPDNEKDLLRVSPARISRTARTRTREGCTAMRDSHRLRKPRKGGV